MGQVGRYVFPSTSTKDPERPLARQRTGAIAPVQERVEDEGAASAAGLAGTLLWWLLLAAGGLAVAVVWLSWHYGTFVTIQGSGTIVPGKRRQVKAAAGGILAEVRVTQGERVSADAILACLNMDEWRADLEKATQDLEINRHQAEQLRAELRSERALRRRERDRCRIHLEESQLQLERLRSEARLESQSPLLGDWPRVPFLERVPVRQQLARIQNRRVQLDMAEQQLAALADRRLELERLVRVKAKLAQDSAMAAQRLAQTIIRAPAAGTVLTDGLPDRVGDRLQAGEVLLELAPLDSWYADVTVSQRDVMRAAVGQNVRLFVEAFPHLQYKVFTGTVTSVSLEPAGNPAGYRTRVRIQDPTVQDRERTHSLTYGMGASAEIVVDRGRIMELLWRRFLRRAGRSSQRKLYAMRPGGRE